jgi:enamine deaminase RidA (YjgF/YER057c/UK114 family)
MLRRTRTAYHSTNLPLSILLGSCILLCEQFGIDMTKKALFPPGSKDQATQIKVSPGIVSGDHVFLTGVTGSLPDGSMPEGVKEQVRSAFEKIGSVLAEAGLSHDAIVEMTT